MKQLLTLLAFAFILNNCNSQNLVSNREKINKAKQELAPAMELFFSEIATKGLSICIEHLLKKADDNYKKYIVGGLLYNIDTAKSFALHKEAFESNRNDKNFMLEYAIELHRKGNYKEAAALYETYSLAEPTDFRINVWLSDCYINTNEIKKAIDNWAKANHPKNHTGIDFAIYTIYGSSNQLKQRNELRKQILNGNHSKLNDLIFLDQNWEMDWWNKKTQQSFLKEDIELAKQKLNATSADFKLLKAYTNIKKLENEENKSNEIKNILTQNGLILNNKPLPKFGQIASDLLRICFLNQLLSEKDFYQTRGKEILETSNKTKDVDLLNIYAYLQATVEGNVKPEIDKSGWTDYKDERFAISYFLGKADKNKFDDPELNQALQDFPNSSKLYWVKLNCAKIENKKLKELIIEVIKREFKTLGSESEKYSYALKNYFGYLQSEEE